MHPTIRPPPSPCRQGQQVVANWLRYGAYGALIGFALGFLAGFWRARRGNVEVNRRSDQIITRLDDLLQKRTRGGVTDDKTDN